jgi:fatty acid amide hydrolase 2
MIRSKELSSREVIDAHIAQIERVNPALNAVVAQRFDAARAEADAADIRLASEGADDLPPFHGVPCSIKECFALTGMPNTAGLMARAGQPASEDATAVRRLREAGAIPMGVTNTSELCMWMESNNEVYGRTRNPYDTTRIVGGSSGGEGAIIAAGGAPFGLGSDIGGSIRLPAFFNGVFGHKPSGGLVPGSGQFPPAAGDALRFLATGPLSRRSEDLMPFLRIVAGPDGIDAACEEMPIGDGVPDFSGMPVTVIEAAGVFGVTRVHPELRRAQERAAQSLEARGAVIRTVKVPSLKRSFDIWATLLGDSQSDHTFRQMLENGKPKSMLVELLRFALRRSDHTLPSLALAAVEPASAVLSGSPTKARVRAEAMKAELTALMGSGVLLYPPFTRPAPRHDWPLATPLDFVYTGIFNVMEFPVTQVPMGLSTDGLPLGVQVVGPYGTDHRTIAVARVLEQDHGGWVPPQCVPSQNAPSLPKTT